MLIWSTHKGKQILRSDKYFTSPLSRQADMTVFAFGSSTRRQHFLVLTVDKVFSFNY